MEKTEVTEVTEVEKAETPEKAELTEYFEHKRTPEFDALVTAYFQSTNETPFTDIQIKDDSLNEIFIDMKNDFHEEALKQFGGELDEVISDYIQSLMKTTMEDMGGMTPEEMKKLSEEFEEFSNKEMSEGVDYDSGDTIINRNPNIDTKAINNNKN